MTLSVFFVLLACGCSTAKPSPVTSRPAAGPEPTDEVRSLKLPFDEYQFSLQEHYTVSAARDKLIAECMSEKGRKWEMRERLTDVEDLPNRRRYGLIEIEVARRFGFHEPPERLAVNESQKISHERERQAQIAKSEGCDKKADAKLGRDVEGNYGPLVGLSQKLLLEALHSPEVSDNLGAWRDCMKGKGYSYSDPYKSIGDRVWWSREGAGKTGRPSSDREIDTAVADVTCKRTAGLVNAWFVEEARLQRQSLKSDSGYFREIKAYKNSILNSSRAALEE
ncbi:hypothetical protein [Streptomyces sp. NBC_00286]|uniref:hypothetical protein n=1 Tax=Streptomyces sp. NBC_00286 TaxID=2975701 RepID=UPI002E2920E6|nr:hypothetical protein [Streptomyces sp. NBC_00286]